MNQDSAVLLRIAENDPIQVAKMVGISSLTLTEVWDDIRKVASTVAKTYSDKTCFALGYDDIFAECLKKVVDVLAKGYLHKPRKEFFKLLKTAMNNHARGIVQRYRFTIKRTGHRPPDRDDPTAVNVKPDISIDDPENGIQVASMVEENTESIDAELIEDLAVYLTPVEKLVLDQLVSPNSGAFMHAYMESAMKRKKKDGTVSVKIGYGSMAYGLGMPADEFCTIHETIKGKYMTYLKDQPEDTRYNAAITSLEEVYGVQVPRSTDKVIVARLFTICARDQLEKLNPEITKLLARVGAKTPVIEDGRLSCFGVLFQKNHRICTACGLRQACQTEAANYGLGEITLSPKLLGAKSVRYATLTDQPNPSMEDEKSEQTQATPALEPTQATTSSKGLVATTERDEHLLQHLNEHYKQIKFGQDVYYTHKEGKNACVFYVGKEGQSFELRFCKPSDELKAKLVRKVRSFYLNDDLSAEEAIKLIDQHGDATFQR